MIQSPENRLPRAYLGVLCALLLLLPALTMGWAYNQISLASDDWSLLGRSVVERWTYNPREPARPLATPFFTLWTVVSGDNFDVLNLINLWVLPAASGLVLFGVLRGAFSVWLDARRAAFAAFLVAALYVVHPLDSSRPWLTMIVYHSTHLMLFGVMAVWGRAVLRQQPYGVLLAVAIALVNNLIVEAQVFVYGLMPAFVLLRPRAVWARRGAWLAMVAVWYVGLGGYLYWRLFLSADGPREAITPTFVGSLGFLWNNMWHALNVTAQNTLDSARALPEYGALALVFAVVVAGLFLGAVVGLYWYVRRTPPQTPTTRPRWVWLGMIGFALVFFMAAVFPYVAQLGEGKLLLTYGIDSRAFQIPSIALAALSVLIVFSPRRLAIATLVGAVLLAGGVLHQLRVTYDYLRAADYQRTLWGQFVALPSSAQEVVIVNATGHFGLARVDSNVWGFLWGRKLMGWGETNLLSAELATATLRFEDGQFVYGARQTTVAQPDLRLYQIDDTGLLIAQSSTALLEVVDGDGEPVAVYTGVNRLDAPPRLNAYAEWYFSKPHTPTACWSFAIIRSPDPAPNAGDALIVNEFTGEILDRRPVEAGEVLNYRAMLPCNFLMQVRYVPDDGEPVVLTGDGQDRTGDLREEVTYQPTFESAQPVAPKPPLSNPRGGGYNERLDDDSMSVSAVRMASKTPSDITVIQPAKGWPFPDLREVWAARSTLWNFVQRNFNVSYRQTIGGPIYAVYNPFMTMIGYTLLLGVLFDAQETLDVPYPLFSFSALLIWTLFTNVSQNVSMSLTRNTALIQKIYIPRLIFPLIETCMELITFGIAIVVLLAMMLIYAQPFLPQIVWVVFYIVVATVFGFGFGLVFAGFQARFRDASYVVQTINRLLFFVTPVVYDSKLLPAPFDSLYVYNPMALVIEGMRWALLNVGAQPQLLPTLSAVGVTLLTLLIGLLVFKRLEPSFADVL